METIAEADMSLPDREEGIPTIFSLFPPANSLSDSSDSSLSNRTLQHYLSPYSITSFFPPNNSVSSSGSTQTIHFPPSISSLFPPTQSVNSQLNSLCSERSNPGFGNSITSIFPPNYSYSSSIESTQYHDQFGSNKSKLSHEFKDVVTGRTEPHFQKPIVNRWRSFKFHISNEERIFQKQVEAELRQAQERSLFPPTQSVDSQLNSLCSERSNPGFGNSITSIFPPNYSYSSSVESTQYHDQFGSNKSKLSHEFKDVVTGRTEPHFQEPNINRWRSFKFHISNEERIFQNEVEAELRQAQERWTYAIYWELDRPSSSPLWGTFSQVKGFYNLNDDKFNDKAMALSFFQLMDSWFSIFGSVLNQVFSTSSPIWVVGEDCLKSSKYYQAREGHHYGLQTMSWIRVADGVMEFGSTELIYPSSNFRNIGWLSVNDRSST